TLSAAGSESNGNTVITNEDTKEKRAVSYPFIYPVFSIIDPSYTMHVDKHFVVAGGIDVIMHVFEQYFSNTLRTETSDYMSFGIIKSVIENVNRYLEGEDSYDTRANLSWAATIGLNWILGQGKVGDWATHRLSYPITQFYRITHGYALTTIYPAWLRLALKENPETMERRLTFLGKEVFNKKTAEDTILAIKDLFDSWDAPTSFKDGQVYLDGDAVRELAKNATALGSVGTIVEIDYKKAIELFEDAKE
ncbi:MAG: iron-containing alcohol dehydrogenase, partial [Candidatus Izemoplasmataceae bacterium]